ncbi:PAS domain S-box protein [Brevibacillus fluminis]|uniref:PAS domain S-box protein n=1 Tax=Brevibacillus fluminis TaxID=511487 RepID=A0A3M8DMY8_9BACL|nr:methyl-accepting chemotaxis protein [Brevibacillus fluminis]RNB89438.1 PAS domain S-box protein [Brevibacillus fluminis]
MTDQKLAVLSSIQSHLAMIMFDKQGHVIWANHLFASAMGYGVDDIVGLHHRIFCLPEYASSKAYVNLWDGLRQGRASQEKIVRVSKDGRKLTLEATYMPVIENGSVEAVVKVATDITKRETMLQQSTVELMAMVEEMTANTNQVLEASNMIANHMTKLNSESEAVTDQVKRIQSVTTIVKEIASQSHMLGLNAAIESARAGEHGRGFEVVANEVRKMASTSNESADTISDQLTEIAKSVSLMMRSMEEITEQISNNSRAIEELKTAYHQVAMTTKRLASSI